MASLDATEHHVAAPPQFDAAFQARLRELFVWRRDVRRFRTDALPEGTLEGLIALAGHAPSVGLSEPWRFVVVDDAFRRAAVRASFARCNADALSGQSGDKAALYAQLKLAGLDDAPCQFAILADRETAQGYGLGRATMPEMIDYSAVMAAHTVWLAARASGIGLGWVSILDPHEVIAILEVPAHWVLIGYFCLGWPSGETDMPALEEAGWERRGRVPSPVLLR